MAFLAEDGIMGMEGGIWSAAKIVDLCIQILDLVLKGGDGVSHLLELDRVFERVGAAVGSVDAVEVEVATAMARCLSIALDLPPFALIASY